MDLRGNTRIHRRSQTCFYVRLQTTYLQLLLKVDSVNRGRACTLIKTYGCMDPLQSMW